MLPGRRSKSVSTVNLAIVAMIMLFFGLKYLANQNDPAARERRLEAERQEAAKEAECLADLNCAGNKFLIAAGVRCDDAIERLAKYKAEWTTKWGEPIFSRFAWANGEKAEIRYFGDQVLFQNGFGAMQRHAYDCVYDFRNESVSSVSAIPGALN